MAEVYNKGKLDILQQEFKQWGSINIIYGTGFYTLNFPISFNSLYAIVDGGVFDIEIQSRNTSNFKIEQRSGQNSDIYCYIAIGN